MSNFFKKALRVFIVLLILFIIAAIVGLSGFAYLKQEEVNDLKSDKEELEAQLTLEDSEENALESELEQENLDLKDELERVKAENKDLSSKIDSKKGTISGRVSPVVLQNLGLSKYQLVCAINTANKNIQYCQTVSTVEGSYSLIVPAGTYNVRASAINSDNQEVATGFNAFYTEYVVCIQNNDVDSCSTDLSSKNAGVEVRAGSKVEKIDPVDWISQGTSN